MGEHFPAWYGRPAGDPDAAAADALYETFVGVRPRRTPAAVGVALMDRLMPRTMRRAPVCDWPAPALVGNTAYVEAWTIPLLDLAERRYLHAYDKNAQFLAACSSVELGLSGLEHRAAPTFDKSLPGYWLLAGTWHTTPGMLYMRERHGLELEPVEAWVWTRHGRALTPWYERLRDARAALRGDSSAAGTLALSALKDTYAGGIGALNAGWFKPDHRANPPRPGALDSPLFRPDWRHAIIDTARCNLARNIAGWADVVAIYRDTVFVASDEQDAIAAAEGRLRFSSNPGAWKHTGTYELAPLADTFTGRRPTQLLRRIREGAGRGRA